MKRVIMTTVIAACIALCATVWPQSKAPEETPTQSQHPPCAPRKRLLRNSKRKLKPHHRQRKKKKWLRRWKHPLEVPDEPGPAPIETPAAPEAQPTPEPKATSEVVLELTLEPSPEQPTAQTTVEPQSRDMVYVPGVGWIENQGPNRVEFATDMYENGNKIGIMGN